MRTLIAAAALAASLLETSLTPPAEAAQAPRPADGSYVYRWNQGDALAGQSTVTIHTQGGVITMQADTTLPGITLAGGTLAFGSKFVEFESYGGFVSSGGLDTAINLKTANRTVTGSTKNQSVTNAVNVPLFGPAPVIAVDDGAMGTFLMLPAQLNARAATTFQLIPVSTGLAGPVTLSISTTGPYPVGIPTTDVVASFGVNTTLWYDPNTFVVHQFARGSLVAKLVSGQ